MIFAEYILSSLKVATIVAFIIVGVVVNVGGNREHRYIGFHNWTIPGAPFVNGFGGFARVFVTASFACVCRLLSSTFPCSESILLRIAMLTAAFALRVFHRYAHRCPKQTLLARRWWYRKSRNYCRGDA